MHRLSLTLISAVSAIAFTQIASAADLPRKAPGPPPPPVVSWTGWYVGLNAGAIWSNNNDTDIVSAGVFNPAGFVPDIMNQGARGATASLSNGGNNAGFIGGGQIGYNWQVTNWLWGIEADIQGIGNNNGNNSTATTSVLANNLVPIITQLDASNKVQWLGTVRGRLGWLTTPTFLLYATGGLAYGEVKSSVFITQSHGVSDTFGSLASSFSETRAGWTAGAGFEWLFFPRWSAKLEYLYYDLGDVSYNAGVLNAAFSNGFVRYGISPQVNTSFTGNIVRAGVNFHF